MKFQKYGIRELWNLTTNAEIEREARKAGCKFIDKTASGVVCDNLQHLPKIKASSSSWLWLLKKLATESYPFQFPVVESDGQWVIIDIDKLRLLDNYIYYPRLDVKAGEISRDRQTLNAVQDKKSHQFTTSGILKKAGTSHRDTYAAFNSDTEGLFRHKPTGPVKIPKIIHQIWIGPHPPPKCITSWKEMNPDWEYHLWTEEPTNLVNQKEYNEMKEWNGKADIWRYELMYKYGGIFTDADSVCLKPLDEDLLRNDIFFAYENEAMTKNLVAAGMMGATPNHPMIKKCIDKIHGTDVTRQRAWITVGPMIVSTVVINEPTDKVFIYPSYYFFPVHHKGYTYCEALTNQAYCSQLWGSTFDSYKTGKL